MHAASQRASGRRRMLVRSSLDTSVHSPSLHTGSPAGGVSCGGEHHGTDSRRRLVCRRSRTRAPRSVLPYEPAAAWLRLCVSSAATSASCSAAASGRMVADTPLALQPQCKRKLHATRR